MAAALARPTARPAFTARSAQAARQQPRLASPVQQPRQQRLRPVAALELDWSDP